METTSQSMVSYLTHTSDKLRGKNLFISNNCSNFVVTRYVFSQKYSSKSRRGLGTRIVYWKYTSMRFFAQYQRSMQTIGWRWPIIKIFCFSRYLKMVTFSSKNIKWWFGTNIADEGQLFYQNVSSRIDKQFQSSYTIDITIIVKVSFPEERVIPKQS